jgi:hypothetical protein
MFSFLHPNLLQHNSLRWLQHDPFWDQTRAIAIMAFLVSAWCRSGVVAPKSGLRPLVAMKALSTRRPRAAQTLAAPAVQ